MQIFKPRFNYTQNLAAGKDFSFYIDSRGFLYYSGQFFNKQVNTWTRVEPTLRFRGISAGPNYIYAVTTEGQLYSAGLSNSNNQLGLLSHPLTQLTLIPGFDNVQRVFPLHIINDNLLYKATPNGFTHIPLPNKPFKVAQGLNHTLILTTANELFIQGSNSKGQLFLGVHQDIPKPKLLRSDVFDITAFNNSSAITTIRHELIIAGDNQKPHLGTEDNSIQPITIPNIKAYRVFGNNNQLIVQDRQKLLHGSGSSLSGQLGLPKTTYPTLTPIPDSQDVTEVALGHTHSLIVQGKTLKSSGANLKGQLGDSTNNPKFNFS